MTNKKCLATIDLMIEREGSCRGIDCDDCPFYYYSECVIHTVQGRVPKGKYFDQIREIILPAYRALYIKVVGKKNALVTRSNGCGL